MIEFEYRVSSLITKETEPWPLESQLCKRFELVVNSSQGLTVQPMIQDGNFPIKLIYRTLSKNSVYILTVSVE